MEAKVSVAVTDFNGNGKTDIASPGLNLVSILLGNGDGTFQAAKNYPAENGYPQGIAVVDLNLDGNQDIVKGNENLSSIAILLSNGDGTFQTA